MPEAGSDAGNRLIAAPGHQALLRAAHGLAPLRTAVVHPVDEASLQGVAAAVEAGLIEPVLIGPESKLRAAARQSGVDLSRFEMVPTEHSHAAAETAVWMARRGEVEALMKGALHTDELLHPAMSADRGLRTARRMSHVFVLEVSTYPRLLFVTDAAINISPGLDDKRDIVQNAVDLAVALGVREPRVAILSAVETVTESIRSTIDAAALCKMAERGQISGGVLDGPLAIDDAVSEEAARIKGINSRVAGRADIFLVPDIETGNMLAKQLEYLAAAQTAGVVLGARIPIILTSRADNPRSRLVSSAIALLVARQRRSAAGP